MKLFRASRSGRRDGQRGQMILLFALALSVVVLMVGLVIDGANGLVQRRASQNASDFGALAGARILAEFVSGDTTNGTDSNVVAAINRGIAANGGTTLVYGVAGGPTYVSNAGANLGYVGTGTIPAGAVGVKVSSSRTFRPYFLGIIGVNTWTASADAIAKGGYAAGGPGGNVFPAGIASSFFSTYPLCSGPVDTTNPNSPCYPVNLTPGNLNVPGGFGWLKFGATGKCAGYGLGMDPKNGCDSSKPFLQTEIGPPANSFGCCSAVSGGAAPADQIGSLPGNKASAVCSYYINNAITVTVPVWDSAGGTGDNAYYHIIGFAGFQLTSCDGAKGIVGVWRKAIFQGPTTSTPGPFAFGALAVQLIH